MGSLKSYKAGLKAENLAALVLRLKCYRILARRYKTPVGEIDLVAKRGRNLVFIEVKHRNNTDNAAASVSPDNAARVRRAAEWWLQRHSGLADKCDIRFDVLALAPYCGIRHILNAF